MNKVYIVTTGCYSDYTIDSVFSDREKAKRHAELIGGRVNPYNVDDIKVDMKAEYIYGVDIYGDIMRVEIINPGDMPLNEELGVVQYTFPRINDRSVFWAHVYVKASSAEKAKKIAVDKFAEFKAKEEEIF